MGQVAKLGLTLAATAALGPWGGFAVGAAAGMMFSNRQGLNPLEAFKGEVAGFGNERFQTSSYGCPIYKVYGTMRIAGNVIWRSPTPTEDPSASGNIFDDFFTAIELRMKYAFSGFAVGLCEGVIDDILRVWANGELIYDKTGNSDITIIDGLTFTLYTGSETQEPDPFIESHEGANEVPAFRGLAYAVFSSFPWARFNWTLPNLEFEVSANSVDSTTEMAIANITTSQTNKDNIVFSPDNQYFVIADNGNWYKVDTVTATLMFSKTHASPEIPYNNSGFDIDEDGNIHTLKESASGNVVLCKLDGDTFAELAADTYDCASSDRVRVFRSSSHPYVVVVNSGASGDKLFITNRSTYTLTGSDRYLLSAPTNCEWKSVDLDDSNGIIWAVASTVTGGGNETYVYQINVYDSGYTYVSRNVSSDLDLGDNIIYDTDSHQVIVISTTDKKFVFYDPDNFTKYATVNYGYGSSIAYNKSAFRRGVVDGYLYFASDSCVVYKMDIDNRELTLEDWIPSTSMINNGSGDGYGACYDSLTHSMILATMPESGADFLRLRLSVAGATPVTVGSVVEAICADVGIEGSGEIDTSELTDDLDGYCITNQSTARQALEPLMNAFFFDCIDSDGMLQFPKRGSASVVTIDEDDLAAHIANNQAPDNIVTSRKQELELPRVVNVVYIDKDSDYGTGVQSEQRLITESSELLDIELPIAMSADNAKQIAVKQLAYTWLSRNTHVLQVSRKYSYLDPGDVITITENDTTHVLRIQKIQYAGGLLTLECVSENTSAYSSDATGGALPTDETNDEVNYPGATLLRILDCPMWDASNNSAGVYVATLGYFDSWAGASVFKSDDDVIWPTRPVMQSVTDAVIGKATNVLADCADPWVWDKGSSVNVQLLDANDELSSVTKLQLLNGSNLALLGDEIIQWQTATLESDGSYTLTNLLRGRKGSEWATGSHAVGDYFVLLSSSYVTFLTVSADDKDVTKYYRAQSIGNTEAETSVQSTVALNNLKPYSPVDISATRDGSGNITIVWKRRTRIGGEWSDGGDIALGETTEAYEIDIYDGATVVRTLEATSQSVSYSAAQQTSDFGSTQSSLDIIVYQISSIVDRGFGASATV